MLQWFARNQETFAKWSQVVSAAAQVIAVAIGGFWAYHLHAITGESELNPNVTIDATVLPYSESRRLLIVHLRPKNVGKVPVDLSDGEMWVKVRQIPDKIGDGPINFDKLPVTFQKTDMLQRYKGGYEIDPGVEFDEIATFVVQPGKYHVEGEAGWPDGDDVGDQTVVNVQ